MEIGVVFPQTETGHDSAILRDFAQVVEGMFEAWCPTDLESRITARSERGEPATLYQADS
jgi:hypothetical protein